MADRVHAIESLARWLDDADGLPNPMTLATADADGVPHARTVLVTDLDTVGVSFHSSRPTSKTSDIAANPHVSGVFHWPALGRQVVLQGTATELDAEVSRAAFREQPRQLQLLAWAYDALLPGLVAPDFAVEPGAVEREFNAARTAVGMPPTWTTVRMDLIRVDFWETGNDVTPSRKTRYVLDAHGAWRSFPVLP